MAVAETTCTVSLSMPTEFMAAVAAEMWRQDEKWGAGRRHPDAGADPDGHRLSMAETREAMAKAHMRSVARAGRESWLDILKEEVAEAETAAYNRDEAHLRIELVQIAAVIGQWIGDLDSRR